MISSIRRKSIGDAFSNLAPPAEDYEKMREQQSGSKDNHYFDDIIPMGEYEVREALISESKRHRMWKASVVKKMRFDQLEMQSCLQYSLDSYTEARSTTEATEAYCIGQPIDSDRGLASYNNPWDYDIQPDTMFVDQVRVLEMPGTSQVAACSGCNSEGTVHCFHCRGSGTDKCSFCRGTGMKSGVAHPAVYTHPMVATFPHADLSRGYASSSTAMMKNPGGGVYGVGTPMHFMSKTGVPPPGIGTHDLCYMCHGRGVKECHHCKGGGKKPCTSCNGSGSVRNYTRLKVYFKVEKSQFFTTCDVPFRLLQYAEGKDIFSEERPYVPCYGSGSYSGHYETELRADPLQHKTLILTVLPITRYPIKEVNDQSKLLCAQHLQKCMGVARIIRQRHSLVAIPVCKVSYTLGNVQGVFYVYGNERQCYVPKFPSKCTIL